MVVDTILVSLVSGGAVSWLYYANRLQQLPLGVIGAAISVALLPLLSRKLKAGEIREAAAVQDKAVIYGLMMSLPAAVLFVCLADSLIELLFEHGRFTASDTYKTALALKAYAVGLPCYVMVKADAEFLRTRRHDNTGKIQFRRLPDQPCTQLASDETVRSCRHCRRDFCRGIRFALPICPRPEKTRFLELFRRIKTQNI